MTRPPFFAWPGWPHLGQGLALGAAFTLWFGACYGGASWATSLHALRVPIHTQAELGLPLVPWLLVFYMSIYLLFLAEPFVLRTRRELRALVAAQAFATLAGAVCFVLVPAQTAYAPPGDLGSWTGLYQLADRMNLEFNNLPSLHVALGVLCIAAFAEHAGTSLRRLLWAWAALLSVSTVLTHQHHLVDVPAGWLLAWLSWRQVYLPLARERCALTNKTVFI